MDPDDHLRRGNIRHRLAVQPNRSRQIQRRIDRDAQIFDIAVPDFNRHLGHERCPSALY